jgi:16S rRNA (adenine1518-N6/adenine1519-N6)-dimethyltransferase
VPDASVCAERVVARELLTPTAARELIDRYGLAMRKRDGQNLLIDPNTVRRIVAAAALAPDDVVLEVGPGLGSLTLALAPIVARVVAVEIDAGFVAALAEVLEGAGDIEVVHADALGVDLGALVGGGPARLVANLPYSVATAVVIEALATGAFTDAFVMVQREVGERWAAVPGDAAYGAVSVKLAVLADVAITMTIPRGVFLPVPNVDSVMVRLVRRADAPSPEEFARIAAVVDAAFAQRRKTLRNTLRALGTDAEVAEAAASVGVELSGRAEELDAPTLVRLADALRGVVPSLSTADEGGHEHP